jgi:hypothetical protein
MQYWPSSLNGALVQKRTEKISAMTSQVATVNFKAKGPKEIRGDPIAQSVLDAK